MIGKRFVLLTLYALFALALAACGGTEAVIATGIAQTQQISQLETAAAGASQPTDSLVTVEPTQQETVTGSTGVRVSVTAETNCRKGPSTAFGQVFSLKQGEMADVVGKNTFTGYWIIVSPTGATCWLWGRYAEISGDVASLPEVAAPPTATSAAKNTQAPPTATATASTAPTATNTVPATPLAPTNLTSDKACAGLANPPRWQETAVLYWKDNANDELGYYIYKQTQGGSKQLIASISPNSQSYPDQFIYDQGTGGPLYDTYWVQAWNNNGTSGTAVIDVYRCP